MESSQYTLITRIISQTVYFLNHSQRLDKDDIDEIKNQTLLKLTPQLAKILYFERLHLENFVRKTTKNVFWDYLKSMSIDLTGYRIKKRIKTIFHHMPNAFCPFKRPDNHTPWYKKGPPDKDFPTNPGKYKDREMDDADKQRKLEKVFEMWHGKEQELAQPDDSEQRLKKLIDLALDTVACGVSIHDIFSLLMNSTEIDEMMELYSQPETTDSDDIIDHSLPYRSLNLDIEAPAMGIEKQLLYEAGAEEFLENHVTQDQILIYYLRYIAQLDYKEIQNTFHINIKTAESRLSIKQDKKGFLWRLTEFCRKAQFTVEEGKNFLNILNRKIEEWYSNNQLEA